MNENQLIQEMEAELLKNDIPKFAVGDTLTVHTRIIEGEKERLQAFTGTVIARRGGGLSETMALYRVSYGAGMERVFMIHSPKIAKIEVTRLGKVRKSKLYYLRGSSGKKSKVKGRIQEGKRSVKIAPQAEGTTQTDSAT
jgi:large subunit ribosomal protein L19